MTQKIYMNPAWTLVLGCLLLQFGLMEFLGAFSKKKVFLLTVCFNTYKYVNSVIYIDCWYFDNFGGFRSYYQYYSLDAG
ncbi:unnamed protein product [Hymenolepis diminuta]|uniref:Uncharacterized protein n=1 Tax=Hymenolepis diminuta TaxID=6216 RepID=A0A564ZC73_HYMDI|nr:unnamed protein product [Hymenolepis diminuta]